MRTIEAIFSQHALVRRLDRIGLASPDVAAVVDPSAINCRFDCWLELPEELLGRDFTLRFTLANGEILQSGSVIENACQGDAFFASWNHFIDRLNQIDSGLVLEIGSRARSGLTYRHFIPNHLNYLGLDIVSGPNVDVVGDAHDLVHLMGNRRIVAAFSLAVFEHLAMPWKVALELNQLLLPGGIVFTGTQQTWPVHEEPCDFWRYSDYTWPVLFNDATGFRILEVAKGEPARIHAIRAHPATRALQDSPAYLGTACIAEKIGDSTLSWPVPLHTVSPNAYPAGERLGPN